MYPQRHFYRRDFSLFFHSWNSWTLFYFWAVFAFSLIGQWRYDRNWVSVCVCGGGGGRLWNVHEAEVQLCTRLSAPAWTAFLLIMFGCFQLAFSKKQKTKKNNIYPLVLENTLLFFLRIYWIYFFLTKWTWSFLWVNATFTHANGRNVNPPLLYFMIFVRIFQSLLTNTSKKTK